MRLQGLLEVLSVSPPLTGEANLGSFGPRPYRSALIEQTPLVESKTKSALFGGQRLMPRHERKPRDLFGQSIRYGDLSDGISRQIRKAYERQEFLGALWCSYREIV